MTRVTLFSIVAATLALTAASCTPGQAEDCSAKITRFNQSADVGHDAEAQALVDAIATDAQCGQFQVAVQRRLSAFRLRAAQEMMARGRPSEEYEHILAEAAHPGVLWQAAATLAEVRFGERRFAAAALGFDEAIELVKNETVTPVAPSSFEIEQLVDRASVSRLLEANAGSDHQAPTYVAAPDGKRDGALGGYFSGVVRGLGPHALPLPITFDSGKSTLTPIGEAAVRDLARAVREQQPTKVLVVGHTDVRGGADYNLKLSKDRAEAVAAFMRQNGIDVPIEAAGVGFSEPLRIEDSNGLTQDDIFALNRRVEWVRP